MKLQHVYDSGVFLRVVLSFAQTLNPKFIILVGKKSTTWLAKATTLTGAADPGPECKTQFFEAQAERFGNSKLSYFSRIELWGVRYSNKRILFIVLIFFAVTIYLGSKPRFDSVISVGTDWQTARVKY